MDALRSYVTYLIWCSLFLYTALRGCPVTVPPATTTIIIIIIITTSRLHTVPPTSLFRLNSDMSSPTPILYVRYSTVRTFWNGYTMSYSNTNVSSQSSRAVVT